MYRFELYPQTILSSGQRRNVPLPVSVSPYFRPCYRHFWGSKARLSLEVETLLALSENVVFQAKDIVAKWICIAVLRLRFVTF